MARTEEEYRTLFETDPSHLDAFASLRRIYRQEGRYEDLAWLFETRAANMDGGSKAAEAYMRAADVYLQKLGDEKHGIENLMNAMRCDPGQRRVTHQLKKRLSEASRWEEYLEVLEMELKTISEDPGRQRRASALHLEIGTLQEEHFGQQDKAMYHYQQAVRIDAQNVEALSAAKRLYKQMGEWSMVARLLKAEIRVTTHPGKRVELLFELGEVLAERLHDLKGAAKALQDVLASKPGYPGAIEILAEVFSSPDWGEPGGLAQAAQMFYQVARQHLSQGEQEEAISYLQRALASDPSLSHVASALVEVYESLGRYEDLDQLLQQQIQRTKGPAVMELLMRRAQVLIEQIGDRDEARRCYEIVLEQEGPSGAAADFLREVYQENGEYDKLALLLEQQLEGTDDTRARIDLMMELAVIYRDQLGDQDRAAVFLHSILEVDPANAIALEYYQEHFRDKGDYRGLADLLAFAVDGAAESGGDPDDMLDKLEELADIAERRLGDPEWAMQAWEQVLALNPQHERAADQMRRIDRKLRLWASTLQALEQDVRNAQSIPERINALLRMAQAYWDKQIAPQRNIEILNEVLGYDATNVTALGLLTELYRREADNEGLVNSIKLQLDAVTNKVERVNLLRELATVSYKELKQLSDAGWACTKILELVPGDADAITLLCTVLEEMEDWPRLIKTLRYHAKATGSTGERLDVLRRMARVATDKLEDDVLAAEAWEKIMDLEPDDPDALSVLTSLYEKLGRWEDLADVLERRAKVLSGEDEEAYQGFMRRLARVADMRLGDPDRALEAWQAVSEMMPDDKEALGALARLCYEQEDWQGLCDVIERQIPLSEDPAKKVGLSLRLANILDEHVERPDEAVEVLEAVLRDVDPDDPDVMGQLRRLYVVVGEPAKAVRIAEKELEMVEPGPPWVRVALEVAAAWRDEVGDDEEAVTAYERVLKEDPTCREALSALVVLYTRTGRWEKLIEANQLLFDFADNDRDRLRLIYQIAEVYEERLDEAKEAFDWYRRAFELYPDDRGTLTSLERAAAEHELWEPLIEVYEQVRARAQHPSDHLEAASRIAQVYEQELSEPARAFDVLRGALVVDLSGDEFLPELERLGADMTRWDDLVEIYEKVLRHQRSSKRKVELLHRCASILEDELDDQKGSLDRVRRAFDLDHTDLTTLDRMTALAETLESWDDLLAVYAAQYSLAAGMEERLEIIRRSATVVEEKVGDQVKAFRAYLHGFLVDPEDDGIVENLWRLATAVGEYSEEMIEQDLHQTKRVAAARKRAGQPEAKKGRIRPSELAGGAVSVDGGPGSGALSRLDVTQELDLTDLEFVDDEGGDRVPHTDPTMQVGLGDVMEIEAARTGEVSLVDVDENFQLLHRVDGAREVADRYIEEDATGVHDVTSLGGPDLPPARSTWEEFARAYALLPARDDETKREHYHRIAEIWRDGASDLEKAFEALRWAVELDVMDARSRDALEDVAREAGMLEDMAEVLVNILAQSHGVDRLVFLHSEIARIFKELDNLERAETHYRSILSIKPDFRPAFDSLKEIYRTQERWKDLAALEERQMEDLLDQLPAGPEREEKLRELARLYADKLDQPYEAMEAWNKVLAMTPDDLEAYQSIARLAETTGSWSKSVDALSHVEELQDDEDDIVATRRQMGRIYKTELELADRAINAYQGILNLHPDDQEALENLDDLYETHESWRELEQVLAVRARLADDGKDWEELLVRRAKILEERLEDLEGAAECYDSLRGARPDDSDYWENAVRLLRELGRAEDALALLEERLEYVKKKGLSAGAIAALFVRQANLVGREFGDLERSRELLEKALELVPDYPSALGELARLHRDEEDWPAYAEARVREAEASDDVEASITAYLEAGAVYRDRLESPDKAVEYFTKVLPLDDGNASALKALSDLAKNRGDWEETARLLGRQIEGAQAAEDVERQVELLTELAQVVRHIEERAGEAKTLLNQALDLKDDHVPAVIALADLFYDEGENIQAKALLEEALTRLDGQPALAGRLGYRLAKLYEESGEEDDLYKFLRDVDRRNPNQLLLKLALGENRFRSRRWREAAKYLSALADHADAFEYPEEVAQACCLAAESEMNLRRPAKAYPLYEMALKFAPDHLDAINALVKYHTDRGAMDDAARYLRAQAEAIEDASAKVKLWDSLGDLYHDQLESDEDALDCYMAALDAAKPIDREHVSILEKVFPLCRALGRDEDASRVIGFVLAFTEDPELRAPRLVQAADAAVALTDLERAVVYLKEALELDPLNEAAVTMLVDVYGQQGEYRLAASLLDSFLQEIQEEYEDSAGWSRQAALYERLAALHQHGLENPLRAIEALEKALELDPTRVSCRERLAELCGDNPEYDERSFSNHQALLAADIRHPDSLRHLGRIYRRRNLVDKALCVLKALDLEGRADIDDLGFVAQYAPADLAVDERWPGSLNEEDHMAFIAHPDTNLMGEVFATIWEGAPALFGGGLERLGLSAQDRISPVADMDIARVYSTTARLLGNRLTGLYASWTGDYSGVNIACHAPPVVVVGSDVEHLPLTVLRFELGRAMELTRPEFILGSGLPPEEFTALFAAVLRAFHPRHSRRKLDPSDSIGARAIQLKKDLPYRVSRKLVALFQAKAHVAFHSGAWRIAVQKTGNRAGLVACADLATAVRVVIKKDLDVELAEEWTTEQFDAYLDESEQLRDLMSYAVCEDYFQVRKRLGQAVVPQDVS
ncbi:MAG: tetratricopeptide repeat protein [Deltaproteobacteria bacterium]|nr:tetratricopeptide repeat protein [Deltaproteobacteria bacterium]